MDNHYPNFSNMESEEITKLVDGVYKNILEKFNPGARQLITAGKGYLKALHGAAAASRLFNEALAKIAMNAQQGGTNDIGAALLNVVSVNKEIQDQQMNILKAFYVDLLVPLETNLEKDTKVVQHEQKKFMQQHKVRIESYHKAVTTMKKQRKKKATPENTEKELRSLQILEDQKKKLDTFCEQSYKNAMTQERRRYGFVLERQCSIAKHWMAYHSNGRNIIDNNLENWQEIAASRELIPASAYEASFANNNNSSSSGNHRRMERIKDAEDSTHGGMGNAAANARTSQLKKARSVDAPFGDMRTLHENNNNIGGGYTQNSLPRAKSDFNLNVNSSELTAHNSMDAGDTTNRGASTSHLWDQRTVAKALYAYMPSGENQLHFDEGDRIALVGNKAKGWQFGENLRTQMFGWFPIAYTNAEDKPRKERHERYENMHYERNGEVGGMRSYHDKYEMENNMDAALESDSTYRRRNTSAEESSPTRMFGDTINFRNQRKFRPSTSQTSNPHPGPPPTLPAPVPQSQQQTRMLNSSQSFSATNGMQGMDRRKQQQQQLQHKSSNNGMPATHQHRFLTQLQQQQQQKQHTSSMGPSSMSQHQSSTNANANLKPAAAAKTSLHSSNDSGFANEPPPQPEVDYSDEEPTNRVPIRRRAETNSHGPREVASWTLNRNFRNSVDSQIDDAKSMHTHTYRRGSEKLRYDLIASDDEILQASSGGIKRTKSFWKFGGGRNSGDDILAGMSLWQHRDLVAAPNLEELRDRDETYRKTSSEVERERHSGFEEELDKQTTGGAASPLNNSNSNSSNSFEKRERKDSVTSIEMFEEDENIYGMAPVIMNEGGILRETRHSMPVMHNNYTPKSRMKIMKTIEIDIENPTESERLSTLKRSQKDYRDNRGNSKNYRDVEINKKQPIAMSNTQSRALNSLKKQAVHEIKAHSTPQSNNNRLHKRAETTAEEDSDEDDNGTLKMSDVNNFFDEMPSEIGMDSSSNAAHMGSSGGMIMKTVKRKDILKQYYTSEDDSDEMEMKSTSSDPYDCIVINDHLVRKDEKLRRQMHANSYHEQQLEFETFRAHNTAGNNKKKPDNRSAVSSSNKAKSSQQREREREQMEQHQQQQQQLMHTPTATILPRTRLMKSSASSNNISNNNNNNKSSATLERNIHKNSRESANLSYHSDKESRHVGKTYGPWYDFWDQPEQHSIVGSKIK